MPLFSFDSIVLLGFLSAFLLGGVILRATVPLFQRFLVPASLIGGTLGLAIVNGGVLGHPPQAFETLAYHFFNMSFISLGLSADIGDAPAERPADRARAAAWMMLVQGFVFCLLAGLGVLVFMLLGAGDAVERTSLGFLLPLGFVEGPGQALSISKVWETLGVGGAPTVALSFAAAGFLVALFVGVPLASRGVLGRRGATGSESFGEVGKGLLARTSRGPSAGEQRFNPNNVDTLSVQFALVGIVYLAVYFGVGALTSVLPDDVAQPLWGFVFMVGLVLAFGVRWLAARFGVDHVIDPGVQRRVTGVAVDYLVVATLCAIQLPVLVEFAAPVILGVIAGGACATAAVTLLGQRLWSLDLERKMAIFGTVTGTVSTGLLLLRIVDPDFRSGVDRELAVMNLFAIPVGGLCLVLINAPALDIAGPGLALAALLLLGLGCLMAARWLTRSRAGAAAPVPESAE